jgi:diguanylate cyclase (GGDEF)-like protein
VKRLHRSAAIVLAVFLIFALAGAFAAHDVLRDQENRLVAERASEVGAQLTNDLTATATNLRALGTLAGLKSTPEVFNKAANSLLVGPARALALIEPKGDGYRVVASIGDGWPAGPVETPEQLVLLERAEYQPSMVSSVVHGTYDRRLAFALGVPPDEGGWIVVQEDAIDPANPIASALLPSSHIQVSFYASTAVTPDALVLATGWPTVQTTGKTVHVAVGSDTWTLVVHADRPLTGPFAALVPWLLLGGGIVAAFLAAGIVQVLVRRRDFALELVAERTSELRESLEDLEKAQTELRFQAFHDGLTGLPNRVLLMDRIEQALLRAARQKTGVALLFMDLDRFKWVNDSLGHSAGDQLLAVAAERLRTSVRPSDTVARLGGDEFVVLCEGLESPGEAADLARRMTDRMCDQVLIEGHHIRLTVSVGVAIAGPGAKAYELLRDGDIAMYQAKDRGRDRIELFEGSMRSEAASRLPAEAALRRALDNGEVTVHYQPLVSPRDGRVVGLEALARWTDSSGITHAPSRFIGIAEETGLIVPLGEVVLGQACRQVGELNRAYPDRPHLSVSVNLSARQLETPGLTELVSSTLLSTGLDAGDLWLEITETLLMEEREASLAALNALSELGVTLVVDDFGTGYSSLLYLHRLPVDVLKIDQSFVAGMGQRRTDDAIVRSVVALAHDLGLVAVAEGVETPAQAEGLARLGCDLAQGYFWCRPIDRDSLVPWLERRWGEELSSEEAGRLPLDTVHPSDTRSSREERALETDVYGVSAG